MMTKLRNRFLLITALAVLLVGVYLVDYHRHRPYPLRYAPSAETIDFIFKGE